MPKDGWIDFEEAKAQVAFEEVLAHYKVKGLKEEEAELRGPCPIHGGEGKRAFHVNLEKQVFHCFSCLAKGNVLNFVEAMEQCSVYQAALFLRRRFMSEDSQSAGTRGKKKNSKRRKAELDEEQQGRRINPALGFELQVDYDHPYGRSRGLTNETLSRFGAGFCLSRGMFSGRFVIPLHDHRGRLVGYAGRAVDDQTEPKYLFPAKKRGFQKRYLLFNMHRVLREEGKADHAFVVEGFFGCMHLVQAGLPSVALFGSSVSDQQVKLLAKYFEKVTLMLDGDEAGRRGTQACLEELAEHCFVRVIRLEESQQPDDLPPQMLESLL